MQDWNAVITVREGGFHPAISLLQVMGVVRRTDFYNTLVMATADPFNVLNHLQDQLLNNHAVADHISRFLPIQQRFNFQSVNEFEQRAQAAVLQWLPQLGGLTFHVRIHRRGFKGRLSSAEEERQLDEFLLEKLAEKGMPGKVAFDDPDAIIAVETIGPQGGMSFFDRKALQSYTLLHLD